MSKKPIETRRPYYSTQPWECRHNQNHSELLAYVEASGKWETALTVHLTSGLTAETLADYLLALINDAQCNEDILTAASRTLRNFLDDENNFSTEQEAESVIKRIKARIA